MLSIVIPVYNERPSLERLHGELDAIAQAQGYALEIIFVDDGSNDGSWQQIEALACRDRRVRGIRFRRNFGKAAALSAGFQAARGDPVITLDADLQDDPAEIPRLLAALDGGLDLVSGWKQVRHDPWHKVAASRVFNALVGWLTGVRLHDHNCGMKGYRREVLGEIRLYGELHRFVPVLAAARGFQVGEVTVRHRPREFGRSKYGAGRFVRGFLDLLTVKFLTGYGQRPQHLLGAVGLLSFALGAVWLLYLTGYWIAGQWFPEWNLKPLHQRPAVIYAVGLLLLGGQLISIGFLAEMIASYQHREGDTYSISQRTPEHADKNAPLP
ncbi:MAG: glycosyltransferase family 2 protein [Pirellulales bacterium]